MQVQAAKDAAAHRTTQESWTNLGAEAERIEGQQDSLWQ